MTSFMDDFGILSFNIDLMTLSLSEEVMVTNGDKLLKVNRSKHKSLL